MPDSPNNGTVILDVTKQKTPTLRSHLAQLAIVSTLGILGVACGPADDATSKVREFQTRGFVRLIAEDQTSADILHEDIPDYPMSSMTMRFKTRDPEELNGIEPGDEITFRWVVEPTLSFIDEVEKTGNRDESLILEPAPSYTHSMELGTPMPDFELTDQNGARRSSEEFKGSVTVITFLFTRCPLPDYCPRLASLLAEAQDTLEKERPDADWSIVAVSIDPEYDTPDVLAAYAERFGLTPERVTLLTGPVEKIAELEKAFGLHAREEGGTITHNLRTGVFGADGKLKASFNGSQWASRELADAMIKALRATSNRVNSPDAEADEIE